jgi:hypothetical protein
LPSIIASAVADVRQPHSVHSHVHDFASNPQLRLVPHVWQAKPPASAARQQLGAGIIVGKSAMNY